MLDGIMVEEELDTKAMESWALAGAQLVNSISWGCE